MLKGYLTRRAWMGALLLACAGVFAAVLWLYDLPVEAVGYASLLCLLLTAVWVAVDFVRYRRRTLALEEMLGRAALTLDRLPEPSDRQERAYQDLLLELDRDRRDLALQADRRRRETIDYYTMWVHQIKTPIAAMRLLLRDEPLDRELGAELFRIERYVELVLSYLRLGGDASDYVICRQSLDPILKRAARKYATLFIRGRVSLDLRDTGLEVLTDGKWLQLAVEQLLSNAVKYAPGGKVSVYARGEDLVVEDNGAGIPTEDLPRIFEKGFTGGNGRLEGQSTGIGLYLCREICRRLGHTLSVESQPGRGSRFIVGLARPYLEVE